MRPFVFENPPLMDTPDGQILAEYLGRQFQKIHQSLLDAFRAARSGHAGVYLGTPHDFVPNVTLTNTPVKIGVYDSKLAKENGATGDFSNGTLRFTEIGVWAVGLQAQWEITPITANDTGDVIFYFYNETVGDISTAITSTVAPRYGSLLAASGLVLADIGPAQLNQDFAVYVATAVGSPNVIVEQANVQDFYTFRVSNFEYGV